MIGHHSSLRFAPGHVAVAAIPPHAFLGVSLFLGVLLSSAPEPAVAAEHFFSSDCLPPANSAYVANLHQQYAAGLINLKDPQHWRFTSCDPPPPLVGGSTVHSMGSVLDFMVSMDGGLTWQSHSAPCPNDGQGAEDQPDRSGI